MRKYLLMAFILLCAAFFFMRSSEKPILRIGVECDYPPNNWEEKKPSDSNLPLANHEGLYAEGYDMQIAKVIADRLGYKLEVKKIAWAELIPALNNNEIDVIFSGMLDTSERRRDAAFSDTYEINKTVYGVLVNVNSKYKDAQSINDFEGAKFIAQEGTALNDAIKQIPGAIHLDPVETVSEMLDQVRGGQVDASVVNVDTGHSYERSYNNLKLIEFPEDRGFNLDFHGICAGVRKRDTELLKNINNVLSKLSTRERQNIMNNVIKRLWANS